MKYLIFYDGNEKDYGMMPDNVLYRFFYSSPGNPFEYVFIDIYNAPNDMDIKGEKSRQFGRISLIRQKSKIQRDTIDCYYGTIKIRDEEIRNIKKDSIELFMNDNAIDDVKGVIEFFESNFCYKYNN